MSATAKPLSLILADRVLLDTNAASAGLRMDAAAVAVMDRAAAVYLPSVALGELYYGAFHATAASTQLARVQELEAESEVVNPDPTTAHIYGRIKADLRVRGRMIPDNDLWIAALALQHEMTVMTRDPHFAEVTGLSTVGW